MSSSRAEQISTLKSFIPSASNTPIPANPAVNACTSPLRPPRSPNHRPCPAQKWHSVSQPQFHPKTISTRRLLFPPKPSLQSPEHTCFSIPSVPHTSQKPPPPALVFYAERWSQQSNCWSAYNSLHTKRGPQAVSQVSLHGDYQGSGPRLSARQVKIDHIYTRRVNTAGCQRCGHRFL
jgi:hypothetical protein